MVTCQTYHKRETGSESLRLVTYDVSRSRYQSFLVSLECRRGSGSRRVHCDSCGADVEVQVTERGAWDACRIRTLVWGAFLVAAACVGLWVLWRPHGFARPHLFLGIVGGLVALAAGSTGFGHLFRALLRPLVRLRSFGVPKADGFGRMASHSISALTEPGE